MANPSAKLSGISSMTNIRIRPQSPVPKQAKSIVRLVFLAAANYRSRMPVRQRA